MNPFRFGRVALALGLSASMVAGLGAWSKQPDQSDRRRGDSDTRSGDTETVNRTVALPPDGTLRVRTFSGYVHITGRSGRDVVIKAVRSADRDVLDHVRLTIDSSGSSVTINANDKDRGWQRGRGEDEVVRTELDIEMPASASLDVNSFSSPIEVTDVTGPQRLETFSAHITVTRGKADVDAHTFSGAVDVDLVAAGSSPSLTAHTFSGSVRARLADNARAGVQFNSFSGDFTSDLPLITHSWRRGRVDGEIAGDSRSSSARSSSESTLRFQTFSGSVRVER